MRTCILTMAAVVLLPALSFSSTIHVPGDKPTIQAGIDAAVDGDMVLVAPGTYAENIDFKGKAILVKSKKGAAVTAIDGGYPSNPDSGSVVTFKNGEGFDSVVEGFTLMNGSGTYYEHLPGKWRFCGGGIICHGASPTITNNALSANSANRGGGIYCDYAAPAITDNTITGNSADSSGGGICCRESSPVIVNNTITANHSFGNGGGIYCRYYSSLALANNTITGNSAYDQGGGVLCQGKSSTTIANSILWDNDAQTGSEIGVYNTGSIYIRYSDVDGGQSAVYADATSTLDWGDGMIDQDPLFVDHVNGDFRLQQGPCQPGVVNPCVDGGDPSASISPGSTRTDGVQDSGILDMGYHDAATMMLLNAPTRDHDGLLHVPAEYPTIQAGIDFAADGETVLVAPGTYQEVIDYKGKALHLRSELGPESTIIEGHQTKYLVTINGINPSQGEASLEGFTVRNASWYGISCENVTVTISNNIISNNSAYGMSDAEAGTGICCWQSTPTITGNSISGSHEGGIICQSSTPVISNNSIYNNGASGIECGGCPSVLIMNNHIYENWSSHGFMAHSYGYGGGIALFSTTSVIVNNILYKNTAFSYSGGDGGGEDGGLSRYGGSPGGGIYCEDSNATLINNLIADNRSVDANQNASGIGGGVYCENSSLVFVGNTVCNNHVYGPGSVVKGSGGGICSGYDSSVEIVNSIFWNNQATVGPEFCLYGDTHVQIHHSDLMGGQTNVHMGPDCTLDWGAGMIDSDPLFVDAGGGDYHLTFTSPCRGSGDNTAVTEPTDFEGDPRIADGTVDMGADEFHTHLYWSGDATPGGTVELKFIDLPGTTPVGFWIAFNVLGTPIPGAYGDWWLLPPMVGPFSLPPIPSNGVFILPGVLPASPPGPYSLYLQAIMGAPLKLTNLCTVKVQ